jgi:SprT protein
MSAQKLQDFLPENTLPYIEQILVPYTVFVKITKERKSRLGSFNPNRGSKPPVITVCAVRNPYSFLITFIHEIAHLKTWTEKVKKVSPHGKEWKSNFTNLIMPLIERGTFPEEITVNLISHLKNPKASISSDLLLIRALKNYDTGRNGYFMLEDLPENNLFLWRNKTFQKKEKLRKRYRCIEVKSKRHYLFSPLAEIELIN